MKQSQTACAMLDKAARLPLLPMDEALMRLTVPGDANSVRHAMQSLTQSDLFLGLPDGIRENAVIVLAEVLNNVVEHAYAQKQGDIMLQIEPNPAGLLCQVSDSGAPMPGLTLPQGQFQPLERIDELPEGGFGWFLIRSLTEDLRYRREGSVNQLTFCLIDERCASA